MLEQLGEADSQHSSSLLMGERSSRGESNPQWATALEGNTGEIITELEAIASENTSFGAPRVSGPEAEESVPEFTPEPRGLASPVSMGRFTTAVSAVATNWMTSDPARRAEPMVEAARQELSSHRVPLPEFLVTEISNAGQVDPAPWAVSLSPGLFTTANGVTEGPGIEEAARAEAAEAADTVYHEARHAEQFFRVARLLAGRGQSARQIHGETEIRRDVCDEALEQAIDEGEDLEAEEWHQSIYGEHGDYRAQVLDNLTHTGPLLETVNRRTEEMGRLHAGGIVDDASLSRVVALQQRALDTCTAINAEYRALPEERDAWAVGGAINRAVNGR
ncbi:MAG: hypothetical protein HN348_34600 [Proteobacteria bacterium]|nr:hypothetical protein [Pseudomonadota bacterium]